MQPILETCASWIFCWPSRQVNNNFLIFRSFSKRRSIVEIKFLFLYCCFRFLLIFISDLFLKTINRRDWLECILLHDPPFPAADPSDPPTAAKQPSGKITMIMLVTFPMNFEERIKICYLFQCTKCWKNLVYLQPKNLGHLFFSLT